EDGRAQDLNTSLDGVMNHQQKHISRHHRSASPNTSLQEAVSYGSPRRFHQTAGGSYSARLHVKAGHDRPMSMLDSDSGVGSFTGRNGGLSRSRSLSRLHTPGSPGGDTNSISSMSGSQPNSATMLHPTSQTDRSLREMQAALDDSESRRAVLMVKLKEAQTTLELQGDRLKKIESSAKENSLLAEDLKKKEKEYRMKISQLESAEKENQMLQVDNMRLREEMQERISALDYQLKYLKSQHHNSESENNKRISLLDHTTMALSLLEEENSKLQQEKEKLHSEIALLRDAFCLTKTRFGALDEENKTIKNESIRLKEDNSALSKKVQEMAGQMIELRSLLQAVKDENERLSTTWRSSAEDKTRAARQVEGYQDTISDIKARLAATSADRDRLFQEKLEMNGKIQQMVLDKEQLMKAKLNLEDQLNEQASKSPGVSSKAMDVRRDFDQRELNKELASVKKVSEELSSELATLKSQYERSLEQVASLERSKAVLHSQSDLVEQERRRMQSEIDRLNQALSDKNHEQNRTHDYQDEQIQRMRTDLKEMRYQKNEHENKIQELEARLAHANEGLREGTALQHSELDTWKNTCERLTSSVTRKESELQNLTDRCHEMEDTVSGLRQEIRVLKDKNEMLSDRDEEAERLKDEVRRLLQEKAENEQMIRLLETQKSVLTKNVSFYAQSRPGPVVLEKSSGSQIEQCIFSPCTDCEIEQCRTPEESSRKVSQCIFSSGRNNGIEQHGAQEEPVPQMARCMSSPSTNTENEQSDALEKCSATQITQYIFSPGTESESKKSSSPGQSSPHTVQSILPPGANNETEQTDALEESGPFQMKQYIPSSDIKETEQNLLISSNSGQSHVKSCMSKTADSTVRACSLTDEKHLLPTNLQSKYGKVESNLNFSIDGPETLADKCIDEYRPCDQQCQKTHEKCWEFNRKNQQSLGDFENFKCHTMLSSTLKENVEESDLKELPSTRTSKEEIAVEPIYQTKAEPDNFSLKHLNLYDDFKFWDHFFEIDILAYVAMTEEREISPGDMALAGDISEDSLSRLSELEHLSEQIDKLRTENEQLRKSKFDLEMIRDKLVQEKEEVLAKSESVFNRPDLEELESKIGELRDANRQLRDMNETLTQKLDQVDQENSKMKQTLGNGISKTEAEKLHEENVRLQAEFNDLKHEYGALDAKHQRFVINYGHDGEVAAKEKQDMIKLRKERDAIQKQVTLLQGQLNLMEGSKKRSEEQISKLTAELGETRAQLKQKEFSSSRVADGEETASRQEVERLKRELESARDNIRVQEKMMKNLREESLEDVSSELQQMRGKLQELMGEIKSKDHTIETLELDVRRSRGEAEVRSEEVNQLREAVRQMESENEALREEVTQIRDTLASDLAGEQKEEQEMALKRSRSAKSLQEELAEAVKAKQNGTFNKNRNQSSFLSKSLSSLEPRPASAPPSPDTESSDRPATEGSHRLQSLISKYRSHGDRDEQTSSASSSPAPGDGLRGVRPLPGFVSSKIVSPKGRFGGGAGGGLGGAPSKAPMRRTSQEGGSSQETPISPLARQDGVVLATTSTSPISAASSTTTRPGRKMLPPPPTSPKPTLSALSALAASTSSSSELPVANTTSTTSISTPSSTKSSFMRTSAPSPAKTSPILSSPRRERDSSPLASLRATLPSSSSASSNVNNNNSSASTGGSKSLGSSGLGQSLSASLEGPINTQTSGSGDHKEINALIQK
ncbi:laminin subunit alpha-3, partial [Plakobranchus ocellatus]